MGFFEGASRANQFRGNMTSRDLGLFSIFLPVVRKQRIEFCVRIVRQSLKHVLKILGWIYVMALARGHQRKKYFGGLATNITPEEVPVLSSTGDSLHFLLGEVIVCAHVSVKVSNW